MDFTAIVVALIITIPPTIMAFLAWRNSKKNTTAIDVVRIEVNSRMTQLLESTRGEAKAEGKELGRAEGKQ